MLPGTGVSGAPPPDGDCERCSSPYQGLDLMTAGRHQRLRGTDWLRVPQFGKLRVCRQCGRLWSENFDTRDRVTWFRDLGLGAIEILAADTDSNRIVQWTARAMANDAVFWPETVLKALLKKRPELLQAALNAVIDTLEQEIDQSSTLAAMRQNEVLKLIVPIMERAASPDLRPLATGAARPDRPNPLLVRQICAELDHSPRGWAYLGRNGTIMTEQARLASPHHQPASGETLLTLRCIQPLIDAMASEPLANEEFGGGRGYRLRDAWNTLEKLRFICRRSSHLLSISESDWASLNFALDPVRRLDQIAGKLLESEAMAATDRLHRILDAAPLLPKLGDLGGRLAPEALSRLEALRDKMRASGDHPDAVAANALYPLLIQFRRQAASDCTARTGECAER